MARQSNQDMKKGFTLIELLVVTAITALLMSILMPALPRVKELARQYGLCGWSCLQAVF